MNNTKLFLLLAVMWLPPWAFILEFAGAQIQLAGLVVQLLGLGAMIVKRKEIF